MIAVDHGKRMSVERQGKSELTAVGRVHELSWPSSTPTSPDPIEAVDEFTGHTYRMRCVAGPSAYGGGASGCLA
jgi:hypothetical protein